MPPSKNLYGQAVGKAKRLVRNAKDTIRCLPRAGLRRAGHFEITVREVNISGSRNFGGPLGTLESASVEVVAPAISETAPARRLRPPIHRMGDE